MNRTKHRVLSLLLVAVLAVTAVGCVSRIENKSGVELTSQDNAGEIEIVIFHTNDQHGRVTGNDRGIIGIDRIAAIHKNTPDSILVDAGDTMHGLPIATLNKGADIVELMNAAGYDAMVAGNHDFNYGWTRLVELNKMADFAILSSNITINGEILLDDTVITVVNGISIGILGITTEATNGSAMPEYIAGLVFENAAETAREKAAILRDNGANIVVALCHMGVVQGKGTLSTELAEAVPEIDVIIDGHSHTVLEEGLLVNGVLIAQTGEYEGNLGRIAITLENGVITSKTASLITFEEAMQTEPDETVAAELAAKTEAMAQKLKEPVGEAADFMSCNRAPGVRTQEMPLGNLVADAYRAAAGTQIAIANGGDIRADLNPGVVTKGDIISILPFGNTLMVKLVTPAILREVLENGISGIIADESGAVDHEKSAQGRFPQISGFSFEYDPAAPIGERVLSVTLDNGTELALDDNETIISLAGSNYVLTGGDYYSMLVDLPVEHELGAADEALAAYIEDNSPVSAPETGRINDQPEELDNAA